MNITYCDLCGLPIKGYIHLMAVLKDDINREKGKPKIINISSIQELQDYIEKYKYSMRDIEKREMCSKCYNIIMMLFNERKKALSKLTEEIKGMYGLINGNGINKD